MSQKGIVERFAAWRAEQRTLVLATVCETAGSTYSKPGQRILIADTGDYQGLVSGGCLEGDLAEHAQRVIASGIATVVSYDLRGEVDEIWGLGIGCDGLIRVLLQRLSPVENYEPWATIAACLLGTAPAIGLTVVDGETSGLPAGATLVLGPAQDFSWQLPPAAAAQFRTRCPAPISAISESGCRESGCRAPDFRLERIEAGAGLCRVLLSVLQPIPRLLVLGAGPDAQPVVGMAAALGWRVTVFDHRPANLLPGQFAAAERAICAPAADLRSHVQPGEFAAAVVMSHHLATDLAYLRALAGSPVPYVGLLGPRARRDRLLRELGPAGRALDGRLHGPAGLDIGTDSPEAIALSIVAEMQGLYSARAALPLAGAASAAVRR